MHTQIISIFPEIDTKNIRIVDINLTQAEVQEVNTNSPAYYADHSPDPMEIHKNSSYLRKIYWYYKNKFRQKKLFNIIERYRKELDIKVMIGVFSGGIPLVFYTDEQPGKTSVIFANMDSWFSDVHSNMKQLWYRRYYSFNEIMEKADIVDFLSPYILEGVKKLNVNIKEESTDIAPCSFIDYSKCIIGEKSVFEIAFSARLEPDKNPLMFLEAAKQIHLKYPEVKFMLMGEGSLVHKIKHFIKENELADVIDFRFHKDPPKILANTSVFVSLQSGTNYPSQSVIEAMACGNAVIASNTGDTDLFINNNNGQLIPLELNGLVKAMEEMIINKENTIALGKKAREFVMQNHTSQRYINYFTGIIKKAYQKKF